MDNVRSERLDIIDRDHMTATKSGGQFSEIGAGSGVRMFRWSPPVRLAPVTHWQTVVTAFLLSRVAGSFNVKCTPYFQASRHISRHKPTLYPGVGMACNAPTCGYPDWTFTDFIVTPIWRACRYRNFPPEIRDVPRDAPTPPPKRHRLHSAPPAALAIHKHIPMAVDAGGFLVREWLDALGGSTCISGR